MSAFDEARARLADARAERDEAFEAFARARERGPGAAQETRAALRRAREQEHLAFAAFADFTDPRDNLERLADAVPFLLFGVRLETRFKTVKDGRQLWVRIYPDTSVIDTFEPVLAKTEVAAAKAYWRGVWRAGGVEDDERGAWRGLVASHGAGRAAYAVESFRPLNEPERPVKASAAELILVIATDDPPDPAHRPALAGYWEAVWRADGDGAGVEAARAALEDTVGGERAAELIDAYRPYNLDERPPEPPDVRGVFLVFPHDVDTTRDTWTRAPRADLLPDRFVLVATSGPDRIERVGEPVRSPLVVGPDPSAVPEDQLRPDGGDLVMPDELLWTVDFDRAVEWGLGFRVDLSDEQGRRGIDRLLVLGVRLSASAEDSASQLVQLLGHHQRGRAELSLLPQGTPTNNTEAQAASGAAGEDADAAFDALRGPLFTPVDDPVAKRDGQWLAELLGIEPAALAHTPHADGTDQAEARAMQTALWPATLGYFLQTMMDPLVGDRDVDLARAFFVRYVSGRGPLPAIRIGRQPYGILATTAFDRIAWLRNGARIRPVFDPNFPRRLAAILDAADADWRALSAQAAFVGRAGDPHATLLEILGLHPASVEFHQRYSQSLQHLFNHLNLLGFGGLLVASLLAAGLDAQARALLARLGDDGTARPAILDHFFHGGQTVLKGAVIDDQPLSEVSPVRVWATGERNYLEWLRDAAGRSLDELRRQAGFLDDRPPGALLYLLLRHALQLGYHDAAYRLHRTAKTAPDDALDALRREPEFVHVGAKGASQSRWTPLYVREAKITGDAGSTVAEHIAEALGKAEETAQLRAQLDALDHLARVPTARLERLLAEHVDCCSHRFDAWRLGLVNLQLDAMRSATPRGVHLGAYGWVEELRPRVAELEPAAVPDDLAEEFHASAEPPLMHDPANGGYIQAPSLDHAATAAILRSGYLANASADSAGTLAVNLSSARVRHALTLLEGMREGQSLGALLGYRFERGLHDAHGLAEVDEFVFALRKAFPLRADRLTATQTGPEVPIEAIEARNVLDGLRLVEHMQSSGDSSYPFGLPLPDADPAQRAAIDAEADRLLDVHDGLADLQLAEGVHQAVLGNFDRVAATLDGAATGAFAPDPEVVRTPTTGIGLTHRLALHLQPGLGPPGADATPRSVAEPALNDWLGRILPTLERIGCRVRWDDPVGGTVRDAVVTMRDLALQPLDLLTLMGTNGDQAMSELDDRVVAHVLASESPRPDAVLRIAYMESGPSQVSVFELASLVAALRTLVVQARPLRPSDVAPSQAATAEMDDAPQADPSRIEAVWDELDALRTDLTAFAPPADVVDGIDGLIDATASLLSRAARFGLAQTGWGFAYDRRSAEYAGLLERVQALVDAWDTRLDRFDERLIEYDAVTAPDAERFALLRQIELELSTVLIEPEPATPDALRAALPGIRDAFSDRRDAFAALLTAPGDSLSGLLADLGALLPVTAFVGSDFSLDDEHARVRTLAADLAAAIAAVLAEVERRLDAAREQLDAHERVAAAQARTAALEQAAQLLLGDDFKIIPEFVPAPRQAAEWRLALDASPSLLDHLESDLGVEFPVDEWLYGAARIRRPLRAWEQIVVLAEAHGSPEPELVPIQLPHRSGESWLALRFPADQRLDEERLLYTAHYAVPFDATAPQCGLLLDEWTEVLPGAQQEAGIAFHFDRPAAEPPQSLLLVTPATWDGAWHWDDLLGALDSTLVLARQRAVEPVHVDGSACARFLPATVSAASLSPVAIAMTLALNNDVLAHLAIGDDG